MTETKPDKRTQEFIDWVYAQEDDRPVNMSNNYLLEDSDECGCLMTEYGKSKYPNSIIEAGWSVITIHELGMSIKLNLWIIDLVGFLFSIKTFGDAKKQMSLRGYKCSQNS